MKLSLDTNANTLSISECDKVKTVALYSTEGFALLSDAWLKVGWNQKYPYTFTWMGRPLIQLPEDVLRIQEVIFDLKPDFVVETGVAHGGSLVLYASLMEAMGHGRVIGVDIEIRPHNRTGIEKHPLSKRIDLIEGSSTDPEIVKQVKARIPANSKVLVILDSDHSKGHVRRELECYQDIVSVESYMVATDGIMILAHDVPRGNLKWDHDNPTAAAAEFAQMHANFIIEQPGWKFNESELKNNITHWPGAWLKRIS